MPFLMRRDLMPTSMSRTVSRIAMECQVEFFVIPS
jgi:hypothetical protein